MAHRLLAFLLTFSIAHPALATSISVFGRSNGGGSAATLVDDIPCDADEYLRRNGTDDGWDCTAGTATGDSVTVDGVAVADPDFDDGGDINFTDTANVITAVVKANSVALGTDTTGNYAASGSEGGSATSVADNSVDGTDIALGSDAAGDVMYYDGTNWVRLPKGTAGQVLEMNAGETAPEWDSDDGATFDSTSVDATTWSDGANASNIWTFDVSGTDHTMTAGNGLMTFSHDLTVVDDLAFTGASSSLDGLDAIDATTETTIEGAIDSLTSVTCTTCTTVGLSTTLGGISLGSIGVNLDGANGQLTMLGVGSGADESLLWDFDTTPNTVAITSPSGATTVDGIDNSIPLADLKVDDGQFLNLSSINNSGTSEGLRIPQATNCSAGTAEGQMCWDTDDDQLTMGDGSSTVTIAGGGSGDIAAVGDCASGSCFTGTSGTQLDSNTDLIFNIDANNDGTETFQVLNGADTEVFTVAEDGAVTALLSLNSPTLTLSGTGTINGLDAIDATSETTLEAAIDALANLTTTGTITSGVWNAGAVTSSGSVTTATLELSGTGTINGLDAVDATTETTIDGMIFDADAETITGEWNVADDVELEFGTDADFSINFDESVDNQLLITQDGTADPTATTDPIVEVLVEATPPADQQVFGIAKGSQASNTALFTVDEDGDVAITGTLAATAYTVSATATPGVDFKDSDAADGDVIASIAVNCTDGTSEAEDCDMTLSQYENGGSGAVAGDDTAKVIMSADADGGITIGSAQNNSFTVTTDGTGDAEVVLPGQSIGSTEILNDTIDFSDILIGASPPALMANNDVWFIQDGIAFEGATGVGNTSEVMLVIGADPGSDVTITLPTSTSTLLSTTTAQNKSMWFGAAGLSVDGTQCATPAEVTINSGPKLYTIICTDNDGSTIYGSTTMPDSYTGGDVTFEHVYIQTAADTGALNGDIAAQCRGNGETPSSTWGSEVAIDDAAVVGSNSNDHTTSVAVTPAGTCVAGDTLYWRYQLDATGTTTAVATFHTLGFKMEYPTTLAGD
jgi:hypothetical protein